MAGIVVIGFDVGFVLLFVLYGLFLDVLGLFLFSFDEEDVEEGAGDAVGVMVTFVVPSENVGNFPLRLIRPVRTAKNITTATSPSTRNIILFKPSML